MTQTPEPPNRFTWSGLIRWALSKIRQWLSREWLIRFPTKEGESEAMQEAPSNRGGEPPDPVARGFRAGVRRAAREGLDAPGGLLAQSQAMTASVLLTDASEVSDRFTELFAEIVAVSTIARYRYQDEPVQPGDLRSALDGLTRLLNSFTHR